jgi:hypothetical protein
VSTFAQYFCHLVCALAPVPFFARTRFQSAHWRGGHVCAFIRATTQHTNRSYTPLANVSRTSSACARVNGTFNCSMPAFTLRYSKHSARSPDGSPSSSAAALAEVSHPASMAAASPLPPPCECAGSVASRLMLPMCSTAASARATSLSSRSVKPSSCKHSRKRVQVDKYSPADAPPASPNQLLPVSGPSYQVTFAHVAELVSVDLSS